MSRAHKTTLGVETHQVNLSNVNLILLCNGIYQLQIVCCLDLLMYEGILCDKLFRLGLRVFSVRRCSICNAVLSMVSHFKCTYFQVIYFGM